MATDVTPARGGDYRSSTGPGRLRRGANGPVPAVRAAILGVLALSLAACGTTTEDRALSGAGAGAATGAGIGLLAGGIGFIPGALIGAAVGGGVGAATDAERLNLGTPLWRR